jgi:hypothetical protein
MAHGLRQRDATATFGPHDDTLDNFRARKMAWWYDKTYPKAIKALSSSTRNTLKQSNYWGNEEVMDRDIVLTVVVPVGLGERDGSSSKGTGYEDMMYSKNGLCCGPASMRVAGHDKAEYKLQHARMFLSRAPHWTAHAMEGDDKLALFYGRWRPWAEADTVPPSAGFEGYKAREKALKHLINPQEQTQAGVEPVEQHVEPHVEHVEHVKRCRRSKRRSKNTQGI